MAVGRTGARWSGVAVASALALGAPVAWPGAVGPSSGLRPTTKTQVWRPPLKSPWQWMIDHPLDLDNRRDMGLTDPAGRALQVAVPAVYDIDWELNPTETVTALHRRGKKVICYVDVGAFETYRPDAKKFPADIRGAADGHWEGSYWLDIRRLDVLLPIMRARFEVCRTKGFDAVEPDEVDGYANESGFPLTYNDQLTYNLAIADLARSLGLSVGLKGDIDQARDLWRHFDWTLNEQCFEFNECAALSTYFLANGKAVFQVEYDDPFSGHRASTAQFCPAANRANFNSMKMPRALDGGRWPCR
jgi:Glycoside-hydrolase family GH114